MPLNSYTLGLKFIELPDNCGPDDLADEIISIREQIIKNDRPKSKFFSPLSDNGIRRLVKLAFYASLASEEGRYLSFRLICADYHPDHPKYATRFETLISDVDSLRRLAPIVSDDSALLITESNGDLLCTGSIIVSEVGYDIKIGRPEIVSPIMSSSFIIRVDRPGHIRITEGFFTLVLDNGRIWQIVPYDLVEQIKELWENLADDTNGWLPSQSLDHP